MRGVNVALEFFSRIVIFSGFYGFGLVGYIVYFFIFLGFEIVFEILFRYNKVYGVCERKGF